MQNYFWKKAGKIKQPTNEEKHLLLIMLGKMAWDPHPYDFDSIKNTYMREIYRDLHHKVINKLFYVPEYDDQEGMLHKISCIQQKYQTHFMITNCSSFRLFTKLDIRPYLSEQYKTAILWYMSENEQRLDRDVCLALLHMNDRDINLVLLNHYPLLYLDMSEELQKDLTYLETAIEWRYDLIEKIIENLPEARRKYPGIMMKAIKRKYQCLKYADKYITSNAEFMRLMIQHIPQSAQYMHSSLMKDLDMAIYCLTYHPSLHTLFPKSFFQDIDKAKRFIRANPNTYAVMDDNIKINRDIILLAFQSYPPYYDKNTKQKIIINIEDLYISLPHHLQNDIEFVHNIIKAHTLVVHAFKNIIDCGTPVQYTDNIDPMLFGNYKIRLTMHKTERDKIREAYKPFLTKHFGRLVQNMIKKDKKKPNDENTSKEGDTDIDIVDMGTLQAVTSMPVTKLIMLWLIMVFAILCYLGVAQKK